MPLLDLLTTFTGVPLGALLAAMAITAVAATLHGTVGLGFGMVSVPTLAMLDPRLSPVPQMLVVLPLILRMAWHERGGIDWRGFGLIAVGRLPGAALGVWLVERFARPGLELLIAAIIGGAVLLSVAAGRGAAPQRATGGLRVAAGMASGVGSYIAGIGGPPIALLYRHATGPTLRSTMAMVFLVGLSITLVTRTAAGHISTSDLRVALVLLPAVGVGLRISHALKPRVEGPRLKVAVLVVSGAAALALALRALPG